MGKNGPQRSKGLKYTNLDSYEYFEDSDQIEVPNCAF